MSTLRLVVLTAAVALVHGFQLSSPLLRSPTSPSVSKSFSRSFQPAYSARSPRTSAVRFSQSSRDLSMKVDLSTAKPEDVRVLVAGCTGYIGRYVTKELISRGYKVVAFSREKSGVGGKKSMDDVVKDFKGADVRFGDVTDLESLRSVAFKDKVDVVVSCLASRTGGLQDSWDIDYQASKNCLDVLREQGGSHYVLLSAICVQKPLLEFQRAKLKLEGDIMEQQDVSYSIVRPTAFFKSLAGQVNLVKNGSPYVMFGDGEVCKANAISEPDLAIVMADCITDKSRWNKVLPVGGPGKPLTPLEQSKILFELFGLEPKYIRVPVAVFDAIIGLLDGIAFLFPSFKDKAEFARIGRYYATEDMVGPSYGTTTLREFFKDVAENGLQGQELGDQAVFNIKGE
ncbi:8-vinyl reductase [Guillardia theta CCMP2712]|uniref:Divinyl chlorophyllide a 8-vinyl-reductase, chloroplastic n=2 Tax=Guillardia theta TaxID=55529 RepID=L1IM43_GUITC|nr:8-vinyl reductase [Guillardia theta CCMP2712]EKX36860.1 8-vinyl reductase [Guillardia theta CCMP2712]|mmetsp:Transcript_44191/g.139412  ORF Transcript_44191/g.139412 Transcript_44191/m.139412 type:complete len:399 (+) Transcript_44191:70-1266(+)|eukprot:XP_005823840.1 8-vinyl reductase [Guillardia theta CCMP2712]